MAGAAAAFALLGGLIVAERGSDAPVAPVSAKSIAASRPLLSRPTLNAPKLTQKSPLSKTQVAPTVSSSESLLPGGENICRALLQTREGLLALPPIPANLAALALNSFWLAVFHCQPISGDF